MTSWVLLLFWQEISSGLRAILGEGASKWLELAIPSWIIVVIATCLFLIARFGGLKRLVQFPFYLLFFPVVVLFLLLSTLPGIATFSYAFARRALAFDVSFALVIASPLLWFAELKTSTHWLALLLLVLHLLVIISFGVLLLRWAAEPLKLLSQGLALVEKGVTKAFGDEAFEKESQKKKPRRNTRAETKDPTESFLKIFSWISKFLQRLEDLRRAVIWLFTLVLCFSLAWTILHYAFIYSMLDRLDSSAFSIGPSVGLDGLSRWVIYSFGVVTTGGLIEIKPTSASTYYTAAAEVLTGILVLSVFLSQFSLSLDPAFSEFRSNALKRLSDWIALLKRWQALRIERLKTDRLGTSR